MGARSKPKIRRMQRRGDRDGLLRALVWRDWVGARDGYVDIGAPVRRKALDAINAVDDGFSAEGVSIALRDEQESVRLHALQSIPDETLEAVPAVAHEVATWSADDHPAAHDRAMSLLENDPVTASREYTVAALTVDEPLDDRTRGAIVHLAEQAESRTGWDEVLAAALEADPALPRVEPVLELSSEQVPHRLEEALRLPARRASAVRALGLRRDSSLIDDLLEYHEDDDPILRREVAIALGRIKHPVAIGELFQMTQDEEYDVRDAAMKALDGFGTVAVTAAVLAAQGERTPELEAAERERRQLAMETPTPAPSAATRSGGLISRMRGAGILPPHV